MKNLIISMLFIVIMVIFGCGGEGGGGGEKESPVVTACYDATGTWDVEIMIQVGHKSVACQNLIRGVYGEDLIFEYLRGKQEFVFEVKQNGMGFDGSIYYEGEEKDSICGTIESESEYYGNGKYEIIVDGLTLNISWDFHIHLSTENRGAGTITYTIEADGVEFECNTISACLTCWRNGIRDINLEIKPDSNHNFGIVEYGNKATQIFTVKNISHLENTDPANLHMVMDSPLYKFRFDWDYTDDYNKSCLNCYSLYSGEHCTFQVIYEPTVWPSNDSAEITIESNTLNYFKTVITLNGVATDQLPKLQVEIEGECDPEGELWEQLACMCFETRLQCTESTPKHITISNQGSIDLDLNLYIGNECNFFIYLPDNTPLFDPGSSDGHSVTLCPREEIILEVIFRPVTDSRQHETLVIETNDPNHEREIIRLLGTGTYVPYADCWPDYMK